MSLRVLLADESASIRKVFQMGLQDYGAEVKSVHNGLDVVEVAEKFKPDIIFADILLQKKNGYEVSKEVGQNSQLSEIPVVLMWSSFMELDRNQFKECGAGGELEKPFDVEAMRSVIQNLVGMTKSQMISSFLKFPTSITSEFEGEENEKAKKPQQQTRTESIQPKQPEEPAPDLQLETQEDEYEEEGSFFNSQVAEEGGEEEDFDMFEVPTEIKTPIPKAPIQVAASTEDDLHDTWEARPLNNQSLENRDEKSSESQEDEFQSMDLAQDKKLDLNEFLYKPEPPETVKPPQKSHRPLTHSGIRPPAPNEDTVVNANVINPEESEAIIRSETRAFLLNYVRNEFPTLLEKIVREELDKVVQQEMAIKETPREP